MSLLLSTLAAVVAALDGVGIPHMAVGSVASTYYGEPRTTQDVDIRSSAPDRSGRQKVSSCSAVGSTRWRRANSVRLKSRSRFTIRSTLKPVCRSMTLNWLRSRNAATASLGESERQLRDVEAMVRLLGDRLDADYLRTWAGELGIADWLERVLSEGPSGS